MNSSKDDYFQHIIIGGGLVGLSVGYGLARLGRSVLIIDEEDSAIKASRANFGAVWVQGKGDGLPAYEAWTFRAAKAWPELASLLFKETGIDVEYEDKGGLQYCLSEKEFVDRKQWLIKQQMLGYESQTIILDRIALTKLFPESKFGPNVFGASYSPCGGAVNPLNLWKALHLGFLNQGGILVRKSSVALIVQQENRVRVETKSAHYYAKSLIIAAGIGSAPLAEQVGIHIDITPERGQILVTSRAPIMMPGPAAGLRQLKNGTVLIGSSRDFAGLDISNNLDVCVRMVTRAMQIFPELERHNIVRSWAGLRSLTGDHAPIYEQSIDKVISVLVCHSGVTLAPLHVHELAETLATNESSAALEAFTNRRFKNGVDSNVS